MRRDPAQERHFSDEELTAYLDGEHDHTPVGAIEDALVTDVQLQARIDDLQIDRASIAQAFDALKPPLDKRPVLPAQPHRKLRSGYSFAQMAAGFVLALGLGYAGSQWSLAGSNERGWREYVAAYQALYSTQTLSSIARQDDELAGELQRVTAVLEKPIDLAALKSVDGLDYKRAQVLAFKGRPLVQLAFLSADGEPVALCIIRSKAGKGETLSLQDMEGMEAASWSKDGYEFLLIGGDDKAAISDAANRFFKRI